MPEPYLHVRTVEGLLGEAVAITGNRAGLLRLRVQVDRALGDRDDAYPFEEDLHHDAHGQPIEVAVKRARSRAEMREKARLPVPGKTAEQVPWAERAREADRKGQA